MKKHKLLVGIMLCMALIVGTFTACGSDDDGNQAGGDTSGDTIEVSIVHIASESDPIHEGWTYLKDQLEEESNGRFKVTIYGNKSISNSDNEDAEKVQQGICTMTSVPTSSLAAIGNVKEYQVFDYPYLFETYDEFYNVLDSDLAKDWSAKLEEAAGIKALGGYTLGWCSVGSTKKLDTLADYKGQKIRTLSSDLQMATINNMKASATIVNYGEVFTALQQGTVDGMMTSTGLFVSDRFYEVIDNLAVTKPTALLHVPVVNAQWYNNLPDDMKAIFDECVTDYLTAVRGFEEEFDKSALDKIAESGTKVIEYTDAQLQEFKDATQVVYEKNIDVAGKETVDAVKEFLGRS